MKVEPTEKSRTRDGLRAVVLAAALGLALAAYGCGSSGSSQSSSTAASSPSTTEATTSSSASTGQSKTAGTTAPGATLALGAAALVDYQPGGLPNSPTFHLKVSVLGLKKGSQADMNGVDLEKAQQGDTPYYVTLRVENVGSGDAAAEQNDPIVGFQATDDRGQEGQELTVLGTFRPCESTTEPKHLTHGVSYQSCAIYMVGGGGSIVQEEWTGSGGDAYSEKPIVWKAG
jgi:hypothetical protein